MGLRWVGRCMTKLVFVSCPYKWLGRISRVLLGRSNGTYPCSRRSWKYSRSVYILTLYKWIFTAPPCPNSTALFCPQDSMVGRSHRQELWLGCEHPSIAQMPVCQPSRVQNGYSRHSGGDVHIWVGLRPPKTSRTLAPDANMLGVRTVDDRLDRRRPLVWFDKLTPRPIPVSPPYCLLAPPHPRALQTSVQGLKVLYLRAQFEVVKPKLFSVYGILRARDLFLLFHSLLLIRFPGFPLLGCQVVGALKKARARRAPSRSADRDTPCPVGRVVTSKGRLSCLTRAHSKDYLPQGVWAKLWLRPQAKHPSVWLQKRDFHLFSPKINLDIFIWRQKGRPRKSSTAPQPDLHWSFLHDQLTNRLRTNQHTGTSRQDVGIRWESNITYSLSLPSSLGFAHRQEIILSLSSTFQSINYPFFL